MTDVKRPEDAEGAYVYDTGRTRAIHLASKIARKWGVSAGILAVTTAAYNGSRIGLLIGVIVGFVTFRIARYSLCKHVGVGGVPILADLLPASWRRTPQLSAPTPAELLARRERYPRSAHVAVVPGLPSPTVAEVLNGVLVTSQATSGGLAETRVERLRLGALKITDTGFAFLPNARSALEARVGETEAAVAMKLVGDAVGAIGSIQEFRDAVAPQEEEPTVSQWEAEALEQTDSFVIPWTRLVGVVAGSDRTVFERARDDGGTDAFIVAQVSIELPTLFMRSRLDHELVTLMRERIYKPRLEAYFSEQRAILPKDTDPGVVLETARAKVSQWIAGNKPAIESTLRTAMSPALEGYRELPVLVEQKPWLFVS